MTWPIPTLPTGWTNASPQYADHPAAHNALADAINELAARMPRGWIGSAFSPGTDQTGIASTFTDITSLSIPFTAEPGRWYRTTVAAYVVQNTAAGFVQIAITDGASAALRRAAGNVAAGIAATFTVSFTETGLTGAVTRKARASTNAGTLTISNANQLNAWITVEDLGKTP